MEERSLDFFFLSAARPFGFLVEEGLFFQHMKLVFLKVKAFIFVTIHCYHIESVFFL